MTRFFYVFLFLSLFSTVSGLVFECFGKCQCYPEQKIIQCPTDHRNQLGMTSKADIEGYQVNDSKKKNLKVVPEGTFKPLPTKVAPRKTGKTTRPRRDSDDKIHQFKMWLIDFGRKIQNTSGRH